MGIMDIINKTRLEKNTEYTEPLQVPVDVEAKLVNINYYLKSIYVMMYKMLPNTDKEMIASIEKEFDDYKHLTQFTFRVEFDESVLPEFTEFLSCNNCKCIFKKFTEENYLSYLTFDGRSILNMIKYSPQFNKIFMNIKPLIRDIHSLYFKELIEHNYVGESYFNQWEVVNMNIHDFMYPIVEEPNGNDMISGVLYLIEPGRMKLIGSGIYNEFDAQEINRLFRTPVVYAYTGIGEVDYIKELQGETSNDYLHYGDPMFLIERNYEYTKGEIGMSIPSDVYVPFTELINKYYGVTSVDRILFNVYSPYDINDESLYSEIVE